MKRAALALLLLTSCLDGTEVEDKTYPCRKPGDCAEGFECDETRWICVPTGTAVDAGAGDAATSD
jgi:hypothetical protein